MACNKLIKNLCEKGDKFRILKAHTKGSADKTYHYTIQSKKRYHLRLDAKGNIFQITELEGQDLGVVPPWVAPGQS